MTDYKHDCLVKDLNITSKLNDELESELNAALKRESLLVEALEWICERHERNFTAARKATEALEQNRKLRE